MFLIDRVKTHLTKTDTPPVRDADVVAYVNEARSDAERQRIAREATRRSRRG